MTNPYVYRIANVHRVVDADTLHLTLSLGLYLSATIPVRLLGVDAPELNQGSPYERRKAREARDFVTGWFTQPGTYWVQTEKDPDSFGRWLGYVWRDDDHGTWYLTGALQVAGFSTEWPIRWHQVHDPERNMP